MTARDAAADSQVLRIERALENMDWRLIAVMQREDAGDATADTMPIHDEVARLLRKVAKLRPITDAGIASKARIAVNYLHLGHVGSAILHSLAEDLQIKSLERGRLPRSPPRSLR